MTAVERAEQAQQQPKPDVMLNGPMGTVDQAWRMASALAQSSLIPQPLRNKASDVLVTILYGQEVGLSPMQALQSIYVVNGRPSMSGQLWLALVRRAGHRVELVVDEKKASCTITRADDGTSHTETFTWADAERAKLVSKDVWKAWPKRMLGWRAVSNCATISCPEVALGFEMTEAIPDPAPQAPQPTLREVAAEREKPAEPVTVDAEVVAEDDAPSDEEMREELRRIAAEAEAEAPDDAPPSGLFAVDD